MAFNINSINIKADCEAGAWLHFADPYDPSQPLYADEKGKVPVRIKVKGARSEAMRDFSDEVARIQAETGYETGEEKDATLVANLIIDWENIEVDGKPDFSHAAAVTLFRKIPEFKMQVISFSVTLKNFKGSASKG